MTVLPDDLIDTYLSDQWRIGGGPQSRQLREELRDRLIPITVRAFGSVDASLDILLKESPFSNGNGIPELLRAYELYWLRKNREAVEAGDRSREQICSSFRSQFHQLYCFECEKLGTSKSRNGELYAVLRTDYCRLPSTVIEYALTNPFRGDGDTRLFEGGVGDAVEQGGDALHETGSQGGTPEEASESGAEAVSDLRRSDLPMAPGVSPTGQSETGGTAPPRRSPDLEVSRQRVLLCNTLARELATIKTDLEGFCEAAELKSRHAGFALWEHITNDELSELISGTAFAPRAFAENMVLRHYGLTSRESLKKDRQKLRKHQGKPQ